MNALRLLALSGAIGLATAAWADRVTVNPPTGADICTMSSLDLTPITCYDDAGKTKTRANLNTTGGPIVVRDTLYTSGVGTHAPSVAAFKLNGAKRFVASLGVDDQANLADNHGVVDFTLTLYKGSTPTVYRQTTLKRTDAASYKLDVDLTGYDYMKCDVATGSKAWADHFDYCNAYFVTAGTAPQTIDQGAIGAEGLVELPKQGANGEEIVPLSSLDITKMVSGWGTTKANKSIEGNTLTIKGTRYASGIGIHASAKIIVKLNGSVTNFHAIAGIDDEVTQNGDVTVTVTLRGEGGSSKWVTAANLTRTGSTVKNIDVDCLGWKYLIIDIDQNGSDAYDHVDIANAYFEYKEQNSTRPEAVSEDQLSATLACATQRFGMPGVRMVHPIVVTSPDATVQVTGLPDGLIWNAARGHVEGIIATEGEYTYNVTVTNDGVTETTPVAVTISRNLIQPTPFMGWLSWNVVQGDISESVVRTVADAMVSSGLADAGYRYLVLDDLWHADAREAGTNNPLPDPKKFPNGMKAAADYAHDKGLKFGIYSDGGSRTCAGRFGSFGYETVDANAYAKWGVDLLKYDYCNAPADPATCQARYKAMGDALKASGRDILFYICEWGVREPWKWGAEAGGSTWRCTYDTRDGWNGKPGGIGVMESLAGMKDLWPYSGPNRYNDADMMCVGIHGTGRSSNDLVVKPGMTQDEYRTQFAMWCMWASPLTLSFDLRKPISDDDLALMTNPEMIALNQDRLGLQARWLGTDGNGLMLFAKDLENGDVAVAVVNTSASDTDYRINLADIPGLDAAKEYTVRDVQTRSDAGKATGSLTVPVRTHATAVLRFADTGGIAAATLGQPELNVQRADSTVTVTVRNAGGRPSRVLVATPDGNIVAATTTADDTVTLAVPNEPVLLVNAVCAGRAMTAKAAR